MKIQVIEGSVRSGRLGARVAQWAMAEAAKIEGLEVELVRLADFPLPLYAEDYIPVVEHTYTDPMAQAWSAKIAGADGYIVVSAEYNHSIPGALKNALDYLYNEVTAKPVGIVTYSNGIIGGARAGQHLVQVLGHLQMVALPLQVAVGRADKLINEAGELQVDGPDKAMAGLCGQLVSYGAALKPLQPQPAAA